MKLSISSLVIRTDVDPSRTHFRDPSLTHRRIVDGLIERANAVSSIEYRSCGDSVAAGCNSMNNHSPLCLKGNTGK